MDSFDRLAAQAQKLKQKESKRAKPPAPSGAPDPLPFPAWSRMLSKRLSNRWCSFLHPIHGKVAGYCEKADFAGYSEPGNIPDFALLICGRAVKRNEITVRLVESRAQFFDSEQEAVEDCKTTTTTESK